jgi:putative RecB family exonuclease
MNSNPGAGPDSPHGGAVESQPVTRKPFELKHISHSAANAYLTCGERYRLERVEGHRGPPHLAAVAGSAFHAWTEAYDKHETDEPTDFVDFFLAGLERVEADQGYSVNDLQFSKAEPSERWLSLGPELCGKYMLWRADHSSWSIDNIEYGYTQDLGLSVPAVGFIDREFETDKGRFLVDIKTNAKMPRTPQLVEYAVIRRLQGVHTDYVAYYDARRGKLTDPIDPNPWTEQWLKEYYGYVINKIQAGQFKANPGFQCRWCSVREICEYREIK